MHSPVRSLVTAFAAAFFLFQAGNATATEIKILSAVGMKAALDELGPKFERASGHTLRIEFANLGAVLKRAEDGETADVVILPRQGIDRLVGPGTARSTSVTVLARAGIGLAVRKGALKPDIATPQALKHALLEAKSVTYLDPAGGGTSGVHFVKVLDRLGIADEMKSKTVLHANARAAGILIANGQAGIGVNLIQELTSLPDIEVIGPLPDGLQNMTVYAAVIMTDAKDDATAARALIDFLRTAEAAAVIKAKGMEPD
jgi:molybdate transport system substrate-binding protein